MNTGPAACLILTAAVYNAVAGSLYSIDSIRPDFVFLAFAYLAFFAPVVSLTLLALLASVLLDILSLDPAGSHAAGLLPAVWLLGRSRGWFVVDTSLLRWVLVYPCALLELVLREAYTGLQSTGPEIPLGDQALAAAYTTVAGLAVHALLDRFRRTLGWKEDRALARWRP